MRSLAAAVSIFALTVTSAASRAPQIPSKFTNLQLLPKAITQQQLVPIMRQFCLDLNIRCEHCHVGQGNDLSKFDFASDEKPTKKTARVMMAMVATINQQLLKDVGTPSPDGKVGCYTCHRGALKPPARAPAVGRGHSE